MLFFVGAASAQSGNQRSKQRGEKTTEKGAKQTGSESSEDKPLRIIKKAPPRVSVFEKCFKDYGTPELRIQVRVTFEATGEIGAVEIVSHSDCREFDDEAVRVARLIRFEPAVKDGSPVTVTKQVVYVGGIGRPSI